MRQRLNDNPVILVGLLVIGVAFLLVTRMNGGSKPPADQPAATTDATVVTTEPAPAAGDAASAASADVAPAAAPTPAPVASDFKAGPGLPTAVADAYADGKVVTLLVYRERGIDDRKVKSMVEGLRVRSDTAVFLTKAAGIAKYSRITQGVDVERVPALIIVRPKSVSKGAMPEATVSYGYQHPETVQQGVRDALYKGRSDLPYYPR